MSAEIKRLPQFASPSIDQVFEDFLSDQRQCLKAMTFSKYESVVELLRHHLNGYAYEGLSKAETALFEKYYNAGGEEHREFCELFRPEKILENIGMFLSYFMIRKVMAGQDLMRVAGTVARKLAKWLAEKGYVSEEEAQSGADIGGQAARDLPKAERAAQILYEAARNLPVGVSELEEEDRLAFDHYTVVKIEPGKVWVEASAGGYAKTLGPIAVPKLRPGTDPRRVAHHRGGEHVSVVRPGGPR